jgi:hypothetical protein
LTALGFLEICQFSKSLGQLKSTSSHFLKLY